MSMVCGLDLHRQQITFDALETVSGEVWRGRVSQPDRERFRRWLTRDVARRANGEPVTMAVEGCTGWRYVAEEIIAAGFEVHVAEPADTQTARGKQASGQDRPVRRPAVARVVAAWRAARVVGPADGGVGVAGTGPALQVAARSAPGVDPADPRRAVPTWRRRATRRDRHAGDADVAGQRSGDPDRGGPPAHRGGLRDDRRHRRPPDPAAGPAATLRPTTAGVSSADRRPLRDRWADRRGGVVRARRLSPLHPLAAGGASQRAGRHRRLLRPTPRRRLLDPAGAVDAAMGAVRSRHVRGSASAAPTTPTTRR